jgi:hypothetical protein
MQANLTHGFTSKEYMGEPLPQFVINRRPVRLSEGNDILTEEENETIQFSTYLRIMQCVECSSADSPRVVGVLPDFAAREKLNIICSDSGLMNLATNNRMTKDARKLFYRELKAHMNWHYKNTTVLYSGVINLEYMVYVECTVEGMHFPKKTCLRREILGIRAPAAKHNLFVGVMECAGELDGSVSCVYYEDEGNEHFINTCINGNLGPFLYQYLTNVRKYAPCMVNQLLSGSLVPSIALALPVIQREICCHDSD